MTDSQQFPPGNGSTDALTRRSARGGDAGSSSAPATGLRGLIAKHPVAWIASAAAVAFLLLGTGAVFAGMAVGSARTNDSVSSGEAAIDARPQPTAFPADSVLRTCSVAEQASNPVLATLSATVINASTGETLFDRNGATPQAPSNVMMLLTAAAAIQALRPDAVLTTKVIDGSAPGSIVLVGGGDPTLATTSRTFYEGAPQIDDLAAAALQKYEELHPDVPVTQIVLDSTYWDPADKWDPSWPASLRSDGFQPYITALMVDGDRADPTRSVSGRGSDPVARAGEAFAAAAGLENASFSRGAAVGTTVLAEVQSQPIKTLVQQMLKNSDDALAEMLARAVSKAQGGNGGSASLAQTIPGALAALEIPDTTSQVIKDGAGESPLNAVSPLFVAQLAAKIQAGSNNLDIVRAGMPGEGAVVASPGVMPNERTLAGIVTANDGTPLAFAFYAIGEGAASRETGAALDELSAALANCGNNLSNN